MRPLRPLVALAVLTVLTTGPSTRAESEPAHRHKEQVKTLLLGADGAYVYSLSFDWTIARIPTSGDGEVLLRDLGGLLMAACLVEGGDLLVGGNLESYHLGHLGPDLQPRRPLGFGIRSTIDSLHCLGHPRYAAITAANELLVFDVYTGAVRARESIFGGFLGQARASPEGTWLAVTSQAEEASHSAEPCRLSVFDAKGALRGTWDFPSCAEYRGAQLYLPDEKTLYLVTQDRLRTLRLPPGRTWVPTTRGPEGVVGRRGGGVFLAFEGPLTASAPGRRKNELLVATEGAIHVLDCEQGTHERLHVVTHNERTSAFATHTVNALVFAPKASRVYYGGRDGVVYDFAYD